MAAADTVSWRARSWAAMLTVPFVAFGAAAGGAVGGLLATVLAIQVLVLWSVAPHLGRAVRAVLVRFVPAAVGTFALLLALDWVVGSLWDRATGDVVDTVPAVDLASADLPPTSDERAATAAMAGSPWADRYFAELGSVPFDYLPFVGPREAPVHGRYVNSADGIRRSYHPAGADGRDATTVWFFGGSTLWGEGQRDLHTIPSEVARLAEADGETLHVVNYGLRGYTAFQEFLVFEQELARRDPPDLAVFYHGINEQFSLLQTPDNLGSQPSIFQLGDAADAFHRAPPLPGEPAPDEPSLVTEYVEESVVHHLLRAARDAVEEPAGADEPRFVPSQAQIDRSLREAEQIYRRSLDLIRHVADEHDVPALVFWQPGGEPPTSTLVRDDYTTLGARVASLGIDISDALVDPPAPIYIDGVHTNELGARMAATAIWTHLRPALDEVARR